MATKSKAPKQEVTITAPKITTAWLKVVEVTGKSDSANLNAVLNLAKEMQNSALSIRDIQKVIKATGKESATIKVSHVEGLPTLAELHEKFAEFRALPLAKMLTKATAAYKLGAGYAGKLPTFAGVESAIKDHNAEKNRKAGKGSKTKESKAKAPSTSKDVLTNFLAWLNATSADALTDAELDILSDISIRIIELEPINA